MFLLIRRLTFSLGFKLTPDIFTITVSLLTNRGSENGRKKKNINSAVNSFCPLSLPFTDRECSTIRIQPASEHTHWRRHTCGHFWVHWNGLVWSGDEDGISFDWHISGKSETKSSWKMMKCDMYVNTKKKIIRQAFVTVYCFEFDESILKQWKYLLSE